MGRGRRPGIGKVYYLGRLRYRPGLDSPELEALLEAIAAARGAKRADILRSALLGGASQAQATASAAEDSQTRAALDDMLAGF